MSAPRSRRQACLLLAATPLVLSCSQPVAPKPIDPVVEVEFRPDTVLLPAQTTDRAVLFFRGDIETIGPYGRTLGTIRATVRSDGKAAAMLRLLDLAAQKGGTHALSFFDEPYLREEVSEDDEAKAKLAVAKALEQVSRQMSCETDYCRYRPSELPKDAPPKVTIHKERIIGLIVIAVPESKWTKLPEELRPEVAKGFDDSKPTKWPGKIKYY